MSDHAGWLLALKGILSAGLLLGPTILMGGTLPLLAAWLHQFSADAGRRSARFYSVNSLGAVTGAAFAGFWLVQEYGMVATIQITATANVVIGASAILLNRSGWLPKPVVATETTTVATAPEPPAEPGTLRWAGLMVAMTGGVSMGLELLASRSLALIFGSSLQSFAVVLIAFILGIGLGSAWVASPKRAGKTAERTVVLLLCVAAAWVTLLVFNIEQWVNFYRIARIGLSRTPEGYVYHELLTTGIALVILGIPAALIGAVLPLMMRAVSAGGVPLGARVGALLTWNTLGAVGGTLVTGFLLMPLCGLRNAFGVLALVLVAVALLLALRRGWLIGIAGTVGISALVICLFIFGGESWRNVMSSGIFRIRETQFGSTLMAFRKEHFKILFYEDGPDATVSVEQVDGIVAPAANGPADQRQTGSRDATGLEHAVAGVASADAGQTRGEGCVCAGAGVRHDGRRDPGLSDQPAGRGGELRRGDSTHRTISTTGTIMCWMIHEPICGGKTRGRCLPCARKNMT